MCKDLRLYSASMILVVDDFDEVAQEHSEILNELGYSSSHMSDPTNVLGFLKKRGDIDLVCLDLRMPRIGGVELMKQIKDFNPNIGVIIATVVNDVREAIRATRGGAYNYLLKPLQAESLSKVVKSYYTNQPKRRFADDRFSCYITKSKKIERIFTRLKSFSNSSIPVLITGETGTGKEMLAKLTHQLSERKEKPFVALNVSSLEDSLVASEMFGHAKGAFTGADRHREGFFKTAGEGTLFLDEIGELSLEHQKGLLRVLQDGSYYPVGSSSMQQSQCRLVMATNRNLKREVSAGRFREDLYYRICHASLDLPPLRERPEDIELLADYFFKKYCSQHGRPLLGIEDEMMRVLKAYPFCGNVRELEGIINTAVLLEDGSSLSAHNLPAHLTDSAPDIFEGGDEDVGYNLDKLRCSTIARALKATKNNQSKAAELLGISRSTLHRFLNEQ